MSRKQKPINANTSHSAGSWRRPAILLLLLLAFFLRLYRLDGQALRGDEAASILYAALPVLQGVNSFKD